MGPLCTLLNSTIMQRIMGCKALDQLDQLVRDHGDGFDHASTAAAMSRIQTIVDGPVEQSRCGPEANLLLSRLLQLVLQHLNNMGSRQITSILQSLARLAWWDGPVMDSMLQHSARILSSFSPPCLAGTLWAVASLGYPDSGFAASLLLKARSRLSELTPLHLGLMLWSMAVLGVYEIRCIREFLPHALKLSQSPGNPIERHQQLISAMSWITDSHMSSSDLSEKNLAIVAKIIQTSSAVLAGTRSTTPCTSRVQEDVLGVVRSLPGCRAGASLEHKTDDGVHSIDIALTLPSGTRWDGPACWERLDPCPARVREWIVST